MYRVVIVKDSINNCHILIGMGHEVGDALPYVRLHFRSSDMYFPLCKYVLDFCTYVAADLMWALWKL